MRARLLALALVALPALVVAVQPWGAPPAGAPTAPTGAAGVAPFATLSCHAPLPAVDPARPLEHCNLRATAHTGPANEVDLALDPLDPQHLVVVAKAYNYTRNVVGIGIGGVFTVHATTFDGGLTWTEGYLPEVVALADVPGVGPVGYTLDQGSDPLVEFLPDGRVAALNIRPDGLSDDVYRSADGGRTFDKVGTLRWGDKPAMAMDPATGELWVYQARGVHPSNDGGSTWPARLPVDCCSSDGVAVGPGGVLHVSGNREDPGDPFALQVVASRSLDHGQSWSEPAPLAPFTGDLFGFDDLATRVFRVPNFALVAAAPAGPDVYVVWADHPPGSPSEACPGGLVPCPDVADHDVFLAASHDAGLTWGAPVRVSDDPSPLGFQFMPNVAVDPQGGVHVAWFDQRADPTGALVEVYYAHSADGGATFGPNLRLTDAPFPAALSHHQFFQPPGGVFLGDYLGIAASEDRAVVAFPDTRYGRADVFIATVLASG